MRARLGERWASMTPRERGILIGSMVASAAIVVVYAIARRHAPLAGDQPEYDLEGKFFVAGHPWWTTTPFGVAHASAWKAPLYPAWVGLLYLIGPSDHTWVEVVQALLLAPLSVLAAWALARRLFGWRVAAAAAVVVAAFPLAWEYFGLLYPEALAVPLTTLALLVFIDRRPTPRLAVGLGLLIGVALLVRPTSFFLFGGVLAAWVIAAGWRRGIGLTALAVGVSVLVVAPWTIRNVLTPSVGFVPISVQDGAIYGTFNSQSANDPVYPYAWRAVLRHPPAVLRRNKPVSDATLRSRLIDSGTDYIAAHPDSVPQAFFWNGLSRLWDVRQPSHALDEVSFEGRSRTVTLIGLCMYYVLLPLALIALWRLRRRREVVIPVLALALSAAVVFTTASGTRYRAPLEPLIVILACSVAVPFAVTKFARWRRTSP